MIIYNVTLKVDHSVQADWLKWMKEEHIPDVVNTGCYTHAVMLHLFEADDADGVTYAMQYHAKSKEQYNLYAEKFMPVMRKKLTDRWGEKVSAFRTVMEIVN
jgi:hypothetical protein